MIALAGGRSRPYRLFLGAIVVALAQSGVLLAMVENRAAVLRQGREVLLRTTPVDPRDLMRGEYVALGYEIGTIPPDLVATLPHDGRLHRLYVRVAPGPDGIGAIAGVAADEPPPVADAGADVEAMRAAVVMRTEPARLPSASEAGMAPVSLSVRYGIEAFYVPEGEGRGLEALRGDRRLSVAVRVSASGTARIRALLLDGRALYDEPIY